MQISIAKLPAWVPLKWRCLPPTQMFPFGSPQSFRVHVGMWTNLKQSITIYVPLIPNICSILQILNTSNSVWSIFSRH